MDSQNQIFSLLLALSFLWYMCHKHGNLQSESEHFVVNNVTQVPPMVADNWYLYNNDLAYEETRDQIVPQTIPDNVQTHRVAPVINPLDGQVSHGVYSGVTVPSSYHSTRVPDDLSTSTRYNIPTPHYDDAQGAFQNTNAPTPPVSQQVYNSEFIYT
jgi:hypothetical protein